MKEYKKRFTFALQILLLPGLLYGIIGPVEIYAGNKNEFLFGIKDFLGYFILITLIGVVFAASILAIFRGKVFATITSIIFAFSIMSYVQNMFLNKRLMDKAGNAMDWANLKNTMISNLLVWALVIVGILLVLFRLKDKRVGVVKYTSLGLSLMQLMTVVVLIFQVGFGGNGADELVLSGEQQFQLAPNDNVVVIVLDAYARDEYLKTREVYPEIQDCFKDFTFYDNADCHFFYTVPAMMHMLTGYYVDYDTADWQSQAWKAERCADFYEKLHNNGYSCRLYSSYEAHTYFGDFGNIEGKFDNFTYASPRKDARLMCVLLTKMSIYKYVPYAIKPQFETMTYSFRDTVVYEHFDNSVAYDNYEVKAELTRRGIEVNDTLNNAFTVMHIQGNHFPYTCDAEGNYIDESEGSDVDARRALAKILCQYFDGMKEAGIYDRATIIVTADHGLEFSYYEPQPIYFIKRAGEMHDFMQVSNAPISHDDFQATVLDIIGEDYSEYGTSIFDHYEGEERVREDVISVYDGINVYTYDGTQDELIYNMKNDIYEWRDPQFK